METNELIRDYIEKMTSCKTERQWVEEAERQCVNAGFQCYRPGKVYYPGDRIYFKNRDKNFAAFILGSEPYYNILGAHIDSPRIDIKQKPIYESNGIAYFDTHYYGGIKKYQWVTTPLAMIGVVCLKNGTRINIEIGNKYNDIDNTVFCITDLLPHLDGKRMSDEHANSFVKGENLDIIGTVASKKDKASVDKKDNIAKDKLLNLLKTKYDIDEDDFYSAELELVPAVPASYCGLDKSLVAAYGHDDRVCAYTSLMALINKANESVKTTPRHNIGIVLVDKEEIGSVGATGAESNWFEYVLRCVNKYRNLSEVEFNEALMGSNMLSSDVTAAFDPLYADAYSEHTSAKLGYGMMLSKYNGSRGKCGSNDATPEYIAKLREQFNDCLYQFDEMGKVDQGGGGTIASIYCKFNMNVIDAGVPVLNMHSPMELAHVDDIVSAYNCYCKFLDIK